jgi:S-adenosylmethionine:tRNA ribosyltransferase-isomerase
VPLEEDDAGERMTSREPDGSRVADYEYELPSGRIARYPADRRDESRLLLVDRSAGQAGEQAGEGLRHLRFLDVVRFFQPGDVLVVNESRVLPVRLLGRKPTGAPGEIFLLRRLEPGEEGWPAGAETGAAGEKETVGHRDTIWEALVRPGSKLKPGRVLEVAEELSVEILDSAAGGGRVVRLVTELSGEEALERYGRVPLPPYIDREDEALDRERYQTVYARTPGSVAAPTAGLHFTDELLDELALRGVTLARLALHVGLDTFRPVEVENPSEHTMHAETFTVRPEAAEAVNRARASGGRVWAVGTTVVRTLESAAGRDGRVRPGSRETDLFIRPPYRFKVVDRLVTNFHLPRSTLLMLVSAFAGYRRTMEAYRAAVAGDYRFYSYGDAMVVL